MAHLTPPLQLLRWLLLISLALSGWEWASLQSQAYTINAITLEGVVKNDEAYLRRFLKCKEGAILTPAAIDEDIQRLRRRTGIQHAVLAIDTLDERRVDLTFSIMEQRTLLPQFSLGGIRGNFWWQVGAEEHNLFGREQVLSVIYLQNDGRPNLKAYFRNPRVKDGQWGYGLEFNRNASIEPLFFPEGALDFKYTNTGIGLHGVRNFSFNQSLQFGANLFQERYEKTNLEADPIPDVPASVKQKKLLLRAYYTENQINYDYFYRTGFRWELLGQIVKTLNEDAPFLSIGFEGIKYWRPNEKSNIALRLKAAFASNSPSPFAPFVLDSKVNIRGVGNRVDRGTAQLVLNLEYRQTIFHSQRFAGQLVAFSDAGTWRNPGGELRELIDPEQFRHFIGGGIRLINKKVFQSTFRVDYGIDVWNTKQRGVVFGVGQYF